MNLQIIKSLMPKAYERIIKGRCPTCEKEIKGLEDFKDKLSIREFKISGLCQNCQNKIFEEEK